MINCAQGTVQLAFACFGPKSANNFHVHFAQASPHEINSIACGRRHMHHCEQHEGHSLDKHLWQQIWEQILPCCKPACSQCWLWGALALCASCQLPREERFSKVSQSNDSQSQLFLLMWCFLVKLLQENSSFFSEDVSMLKAELTFKTHQYKVINWSNSSGIDCPRKPFWCACIDALSRISGL